MHRRGTRFGAGLVAAGWLLGTADPARAAFVLRAQVSQRGDFRLIGNTLGQDCAGGVVAPIVGTVGACGANTADHAIDVFWRADAPVDGQATADTALTSADARSTAILDLPADAAVTHAFLSWSARVDGDATDPQVTLERANVFTTQLDAGTDCWTANSTYYHCTADITALVQTQGPGSYRVSGLEVLALTDVLDQGAFAGWWMVVLYQSADEPLRNLAVFDGFEPVAPMLPVDLLLSGFLVPNGGYAGRLGLIALDGDAAFGGDQIVFNGGQPLSDAMNPATDFFNSTRSLLGAPVTIPGDLPQLTGEAHSMSGIDLDIVDVTDRLQPLQTEAPISASTAGDGYVMAGFVTAITDYRPDMATSSKAVVDPGGGAVLAGDELEYTILVINTGNDTAVDVVLTDPLPAGVTFVPGSLQISAGPNAGAKTDDLTDDQGEYDALMNTVVFRLGAGADGVSGGALAIDASSEVKFRVTIDPGATGTISNQALVGAAGLMGAVAMDSPTDGDGGTPGAQTTDLAVDACETAAQCVQPGLVVCDTTPDPNVCVGCLADADCSDRSQGCDLATKTCVCVPTGPEVCDGLDNDCNDEIDDGCPGGGTSETGDSATDDSATDDSATGETGEATAGTTADDTGAGTTADDTGAGTTAGETTTGDDLVACGCEVADRGADPLLLLLPGLLGLARRRRR